MESNISVALFISSRLTIHTPFAILSRVLGLLGPQWSACMTSLCIPVGFEGLSSLSKFPKSTPKFPFRFWLLSTRLFSLPWARLCTAFWRSQIFRVVDYFKRTKEIRSLHTNLFNYILNLILFSFLLATKEVSSRFHLRIAVTGEIPECRQTSRQSSDESRSGWKRVDQSYDFWAQTFFSAEKWMVFERDSPDVHLQDVSAFQVRSVFVLAIVRFTRLLNEEVGTNFYKTAIYLEKYHKKMMVILEIGYFEKC